VAQGAERREVAPGAAAEIEDLQRRRAAHMAQQSLDVLAHIVVARALPEIRGALAVVLERLRADQRPVLAPRVLAGDGSPAYSMPAATSSGFATGPPRNCTSACAGSLWGAALMGTAM